MALPLHPRSVFRTVPIGYRRVTRQGRLEREAKPLRALHHVGQQHRPGHRADPAGHRDQRAGHLADLGRDVAGVAALAVGADHPGDADVHDRRARPDHVRRDEPGHADRGDHDVGPPGVLGEVAGAGVAQGHGGVLRAAGQQQAERAADRGAAADHGDLGAVQRDVVPPEQVHDAARRARQRAGEAQDEPAQVDRVQPVGVLVRVDQLQHPAGVDVLGQRQLHDVAVAGVVGVELGDDRLDVLLGGVGAAGRGGSTRCPPRRSPGACPPRTPGSPGRRRPARCPGRGRCPARPAP